MTNGFRGEAEESLISIKGGGVLLRREDPTKSMLREAADAGFYTSPAGIQHPRPQILTVEQPLNGQKLGLPASHDVRTFKQAPKAKGAKRKERSCSEVSRCLTFDDRRQQ